ncbi:putative nuclease HARBI1 isoform X2 [Salarias fasciatus]|uniref:putative nuclease HARBI1 isoform X2 n=1 Tax=Salarias fasciatus TaxID=181472 RepID=UPI0011765656|nr:putative nuclease HARBI1 isoform X2 [Salarias fasciatus]
MAYLALLEDLENRAFRRERVFKDRADLFSESSEWLLSKYRFPKDVLMDLCCDVQPMLERETKRSNPIPAHVQLMSTLGCLANGTFQREMADIYGVSQPTMSRILPTVLDAIISLAPTYIQFPYENHRQAEIKQGFHAVAGFPNIIGAIGCTHIAIKAPSHNECSYINSEGYHSINTQIICDSTMSLLNVVARWPGGTPDSSILQNSSVGVQLQAGAVEDGWLIGDRGYPLKPWLMTPVANPSTPQEQHYNRAHARSRAVVDHAVGLLKGRWLCLSNVGGILKNPPERTSPCSVQSLSHLLILLPFKPERRSFRDLAQPLSALSLSQDALNWFGMTTAPLAPPTPPPPPLRPPPAPPLPPPPLPPTLDHRQDWLQFLSY